MMRFLDYCRLKKMKKANQEILRKLIFAKKVSAFMVNKKTIMVNEEQIDNELRELASCHDGFVSNVVEFTPLKKNQSFLEQLEATKQI